MPSGGTRVPRETGNGAGERRPRAVRLMLPSARIRRLHAAPLALAPGKNNKESPALSVCLTVKTRRSRGALSRPIGQRVDVG